MISSALAETFNEGYLFQTARVTIVSYMDNTKDMDCKKVDNFCKFKNHEIM